MLESNRNDTLFVLGDGFEGWIFHGSQSIGVKRFAEICERFPALKCRERSRGSSDAVYLRKPHPEFSRLGSFVPRNFSSLKARPQSVLRRPVQLWHRIISGCKFRLPSQGLVGCVRAQDELMRNLLWQGAA